MAGTPPVTNPLGDFIPPPEPVAGSVEAEALMLHRMGLHHIAALLEKSEPPTVHTEGTKSATHKA